MSTPLTTETYYSLYPLFGDPMNVTNLTGAAITSDGQHIYTMDKFIFRLIRFNTSDGSRVVINNGHTVPGNFALAISADDSTLYFFSSAGVERYHVGTDTWDAPIALTGTVEGESPNPEIFHGWLSPTRAIVSNPSHKFYYTIDVATGGQQTLIVTDCWIGGVSWYDGARYLYGASSTSGPDTKGGVVRWDLHEGEWQINLMGTLDTLGGVGTPGQPAYRQYIHAPLCVFVLDGYLYVHDNGPEKFFHINLASPITQTVGSFSAAQSHNRKCHVSHGQRAWIVGGQGIVKLS